MQVVRVERRKTEVARSARDLLDSLRPSSRMDPQIRCPSRSEGLEGTLSTRVHALLLQALGLPSNGPDIQVVHRSGIFY